jgi:hypothetical protein
MEMDIPETSIVGVEIDISGNELGIGLREPFHLSEVLDLRSFNYDGRT